MSKATHYTTNGATPTCNGSSMKRFRVTDDVSRVTCKRCIANVLDRLDREAWADLTPAEQQLVRDNQA